MTTRWGVVILACLAGVIAAMQVGKVPPAIPELRADLGLSLVTAGWAISLFLAASALLGPVGGMVGDRAGHRRFLVLGLVCIALGSAGGALAGAATPLLIMRLLEGFGFLAVVVAAPSLIVALTAEADRRLAIGVWGGYMPAGIAAMMLLTPALIDGIGWRGMWYLNAALAAGFALVFVVATRGHGGPPAGRTSLADVKLSLARPGPWLLAGCFAVYAMQFLGLMAWFPTFLVEGAGYGNTNATVISAVIVALNAVGNPLGAWLLQRGIERWQLMALTAAALGVMAVAIFDPGVGVIGKIALAAVFSLIGGFIPAAALTGVPVHTPAPAQLGATNGVVVQGANLGSLLGPPAFALVVESLGGFTAAGWMLLVLGVLGVLLALPLRVIERPPRPALGPRRAG
ncbi:MAG: MFS transporter [Alphaproteobacteria bacterium]|nr:MFS transporter [Alphaproteobacteria bacterium]